MADKYYEFVYFHVKPAHYGTFGPELKSKLKYFEKHGVKVMGIYTLILGGLGEYLAILQYENASDKMNKIKSLMADEEHKKFNASFHDMICHADSVGLKNVDFHPLNPPNPSHFISIRRYDVKGNPYAASKDFTSCIKQAFENHLKPIGVNLAGGFLGTFGENTNNFYALWDMQALDSLNAFETVGADIIKNMPEPTMQMWSHVTGVSCKVYMPIQ